MVAKLKDIPWPYYTLEEYFALEGAGHTRYEYWDGEIVCMSGGTEQHGVVGGNVYFTLRQQLGQQDCRAFTNEHPIKTPSLPPYRYPDASVACGKAIFERIESVDALVNPTLIVEVLSPSTEPRDRGPKRAAYQALPSLMEYLLLAQKAPHATHFLREAEAWTRSDYGGIDATIALPSIGCVLALSEVYSGVEFE